MWLCHALAVDQDLSNEGKSLFTQQHSITNLTTLEVCGIVNGGLVKQHLTYGLRLPHETES